MHVTAAHDACRLPSHGQIITLQVGGLTGCSGSARVACCCRWYIAEGRLQVGPAELELQASQLQDVAVQQQPAQAAKGAPEAHTAQGSAQASSMLARPDATGRPAQSQAATALELQHQGPALSVGGISPQQAVGGPSRCSPDTGRSATGSMHTWGGPQQHRSQLVRPWEAVAHEAVASQLTPKVACSF